jgi:hypothetical protein
MAHKTNALWILESLGIPHEIVFKTLVARSEKGEIAVFCIPAPLELDLKKAARAAGAKKVELVGLKELLPLTCLAREDLRQRWEPRPAGDSGGGGSVQGLRSPFRRPDLSVPGTVSGGKCASCLAGTQNAPCGVPLKGREKTWQICAISFLSPA